jgi:hypothetical protein
VVPWIAVANTEFMGPKISATRKAANSAAGLAFDGLALCL